MRSMRPISSQARLKHDLQTTLPKIIGSLYNLGPEIGPLQRSHVGILYHQYLTHWGFLTSMLFEWRLTLTLDLQHRHLS